MARRRAPTPGAAWGARVEMPPNEKIAVYNRRKSSEEHLKMIDGEAYSGLLRFVCCVEGSGKPRSHDVHVTSEMTCGDVIPLLCGQSEPHINGISRPAGHISLVQGEMERVLEDTDKPLQIALECSTKGLASPKFLFRRPANSLTPDGSPSHRMRTSGFTSYVGALTAHSNPSLALAASSVPAANQSPHLPSLLDRNRWLSTDGEQNSLWSADSYNSLSSSLGRTAQRVHHMSKSVSALEQVPKSTPQRRKLVRMLSEEGHENGSPAVSSSSLAIQHILQPSLTTGSPQSPSTAAQRMARAKNSVGKFFTHSLRNHRKFKSKSKSSKSLYGGADDSSHNSLSLPPMSPEEKEATAKLSNLVSPMLAERKITMSTVMHIHYRDSRDALLYKSLLVSHKTKARDVVSEALQRFELTAADPKDFSLFEVVGRWQDVSQSVENESSVKLGAPPLNMSSTSLLSAQRPAVTSIEEFVEFYSRTIGPSERPYNLQFYMATQEGYTRRFELRQQKRGGMPPREMSRSHQALDVKQHHLGPISLDHTTKHLSWADGEFCKAGSPLFGDTSHHKKSKRGNQARASLGSAAMEGSDTEEDILDEVKNRRRMVTLVSGGEEVAGRVEEVTKSHPDSLLVDEGDPFAPEVTTPRRTKVLLSATSSSPDSGVVSFGKDKKLRHNSEEFSSTRSKTQSESVSVFNDTPTHVLVPPHAQLLKSPFLLNLRMHDVEKEPLIQPLEAERVSVMPIGSEACRTDVPEESSHQHVCLSHPDLAHDSHPLCSLQLQTSGGYPLDDSQPEPGRVYILHPTHPEYPVHLNGNLVVEPVPLSHGDLLSLYKEHYLFLFQDYSSAGSAQHYSWRPQPSSHLLPSSPLLLSTPLPSSPVIKETHSTTNGEQPLSKDSQEGEESKGSGVVLTGQSAQLSPPHTHPLTTRHSQQPQGTTDRSHHKLSRTLSTPTETLVSTDHTDAACQTPTPIHQRRNPDSNSAALSLNLQDKGATRQRMGSLGSLPGQRVRHTPTETVMFNSLQRPKKSHRSRQHLSSSSSSLPTSPCRKSLFSFSLDEEDALLRHLVANLDTSQASCLLGPALLLAMCTEYCHKCHGPVAVTRFMQKTVDSVQEVVWQCTEKLTKWKPDPAMSSHPLSHCKDLFPLLRPTVFWLANGLELHHLFTDSCTPPPPPSSVTHTTADPLSTLHNVLVYTFQQMFYTVSKVLFYSLPLVLDSYKDKSEAMKDGGKMTNDRAVSERDRENEQGSREGSGEDEIVEEAVDFLQALLDLMTDLQLHLQVVSCFYANLFFFINTTLFNSVMQLGPQRGVFTHSAGTTLRSSLTLLEGWACQVGFKDAVLHHLAKLSSILDILAMPPQQLLQLSWEDLREEFPVLHPAQLHHLLSHYVPPPSLSSPPYWTPSLTDISAANDRALVSESYDCHPGFTLPEASYSLSLSKPHPQHEEFQTMVDDLLHFLKQDSKSATHTESVDVVQVVDQDTPSVQVPTIFTSLPTPPVTTHHHTHTNHHHHHHTPHTKGEAGSHRHSKTKKKRREGDREEEREGGTTDTRESEQPALTHSVSHDSLTTSPQDHTNPVPNTDVSEGIGSNTESQEDLLDTHDKNRCNRHGKRNMGEKSNSGSKVADLINSYEETAKLSQSSSESVKIGRVGEVVREEERVGRGKVVRVMSMVTEHAYSQPQTLIVHEYNMEEWESSAFPDGAHFVNIQRGSKGFGILLVEQKDPLTGDNAIFVKQVLPGSTADQCNDLKAGDRVLAIDGQLLDGTDFIIAEKLLKEAEDDVQLVLAPRPFKILTQ